MLKKLIMIICAAAVCFSCLGGCINYIPVNPSDSSSGDSGMTPSDDPARTVNVIVADGEEIKKYYDESTATTIARASESVITVIASYSDGKGGTTKKTESGIVLGSAEGSSYVVVAHHLIEGATTVGIYVNGDETAIASTYLGTDPQTDLCVLNVKKELKPAVVAKTLYDSDGNEYSSVGQSVFTVSDTLGKKANIVTKGIICGQNYKYSVGEGKYERYLLTDAFVGSSSTGGGLFSEDGGLLMGVINASIESGGEWKGYVLPIDTVLKVFNEIVSNPEHCVTGRYKLGFAVEDVRTSWGPTESVKFTEVSRDGSFYAGGNGLKTGDLIKAFRLEDDENWTEVGTAEEMYDWFYVRLADRLKVGVTVYFRIERNETRDDIQIKIQQYKYSSVDRY